MLDGLLCEAVAMPSGYLRSLNPRLPLPVWLLQVGGLMNSFGNGLALPFLVIYLHNVRGFSLGTAGLIVAVSSLAQLAAGILAGPLIDRVGPRPTLAGGLVLQAIGYGLLPLVRVPWEAFVLIAIEGAGSAGFWPSQSTLISRLSPTARRHAAFAQQRVTMNLGIGLGGLAAGLIAVVGDPTTFTVLFVLDALTFLAYVGVLAFVHDPGVPEDEVGDVPATYAAVLRHKTFLGLWTLNFMFVAAGYSLFNLLPAFARDQAGLSERQIGAIFFVITLSIVLAQLPISRWIEGRRRMRALALMPALWAVAWLLVDAGGYWFTAGTAFMIIALRRRSCSGSASASTGRRTRRSSPTSAHRTCGAATSPCTASPGGSPGSSGRRSAASSSPPRPSRSGRSPRSCA